MKISRYNTKDGEGRYKQRTRWVLTRGAVASTLLLASCQTFESKPVDLGTYAQAWKAQGPADGTVEDFADKMAKSSGKMTTFDPSDGVTLEEAKLIALVYNPDLRVARLRAGIAKADAEYAGLWDDPTLSFDVLKISQGVPNPWVIGSALSLTLPLSGRLQAEKGRAQAELHVELDRIAETEWQVIHDLQQAWLSWSAERAKLEQARAVVGALESIVKSTDALAEQGELPKTESALFNLELVNRRVERDGLVGSVAAEDQEIRTLMGISPKAPIELRSDLAIRPAQASEEQLAKHNPTLNRLRSEYDVSEQTLLREIRKQYPDLQVGPKAEEDQGQSRIGFLGAIPLPILNANRGGIAKARAEREVAQAAYETEFQRKLGQLNVQLARLAALQTQRATIGKTLIPMVDRQAEDAEKIVQLGEGGSLVLLESLTRRYEAKLKVISMQYQYSLAATEIQRLLGPNK